MLGSFAPKISSLLLLFPLLFSSGRVYAQSPIVPSPALERSLCANTFATEKLWFWQSRLKLQEWNISVVMARASELKPKTLGNIHWDSDKKTATISVLDPADYRIPAAEMYDDMEFTVVHELIHLEFAPVLSDVTRNSASRREEEHAVNQMADALLKLQRGR